MPWISHHKHKIEKNQQKVSGPPPKLSASNQRTCGNFQHCLSRRLSGRFNYERQVPHKQYFAGTLLGMSSCASYVSRTHDVIDDVTTSHSRSNLEMYIFWCIYIYIRQYLSYSVDQKVKMSEILMAILLVYPTSGITSGKKVCCELKMAAIFKILRY